MDQLAVIGFAHPRAAVPVLERVALSAAEVEDVYEEVDLRTSAEMVLVSTCNRMEIYVYGSRTERRAIVASWKRRARGPWPEKSLRVRRGRAAARHVIETAAGLRSQVTGDDQIIHQLRRAYERADNADAVGDKLHRLLQTALRAGKRVRRTTCIGSGVSSVASLAVARSRSERGEPSEGGLLVLGLGKVGRSVIHALLDEGEGPIRAANRSARAWDNLDPDLRHRLRPTSWSRRHEAVQSADRVFVATGARQPVLTAEAMRDAGGLVDGTSDTRIYDLALPRNVAPEVDTLPGIELVDLSDLGSQHEVLDEDATCFQEVYKEAEAVCREETDTFVAWLERRNTVRPAIEALTGRCREVRSTLLSECSDHLPENDRRELDRLTRSILQKVIARPIARLRGAVESPSDELETVEEAVEMTAELFGGPTGR